MATILNQNLTVQDSTATSVTVTVTYTLRPTNIEKLAGSVFTENIQLIGDDSGTDDDIVITNFPGVSYAVNDTTTTVERTRTRTVLKSAMNEDPGFSATGAQLSDEAFAKITIVYAANPPIQPTNPVSASTNIVSGTWR